MKRLCSGKVGGGGVTVVEVTVAIVILGLSTSTILHFVASADRVRGRAVQIAAATRVVQNEVERVRRTAAMLQPLRDTTYTDRAEGLDVEVQRTVTDCRTGGPPPADVFTTVTVRIEAFTALQESPLVTVRMLQGYER